MTKIRSLARAFSLATASVCLAGTALSQAASPPSDPARLTRSERSDLRNAAPLTSFHLQYSSMPNDGNEILTALRLMLDPSVKLYLVQRDNTILLRGLPDDVAFATNLVHELDRPRTTYRLTFTLSQYDGTRRLSSSDYTMTMLEGQRVTMRQGSRIPVLAGHSDAPGASGLQMTYVNVGLDFDATLTPVESGAVLKAKVEQSSLADPQPSPSATPASVNPIIHQTVLEGVSSLQLGRTTSLGTLDAQSSSQRIQVEVKLEKLP